ncbi:hypothetical protein LTR37_010174 [Vermiconidia calcicola]|uniref:Uncharacterized protein n=1 Tax=Vermiconidia calcicola TaxID=1690605 RepID=A0ACC3N5W3_9PEZI|nr:hypothetical protein LTR37_010174 [Vermiconidia calcicola]
MKIASIALFASAATAAVFDTCKDSPNTEFTVDRYFFDSFAEYSTPSHLAKDNGKIEFDLMLSSVKKPILRCSATSVIGYPIYFDGAEWFDCKDRSDQVAASFSYNLKTGDLKIRSEWNCPNGSSWKASGKTNVGGQGECEHFDYENPNWTVANPKKWYRRISTTCAPAIGYGGETITFKPAKIESVA